MGEIRSKRCEGVGITCAAVRSADTGWPCAHSPSSPPGTQMNACVAQQQSAERRQLETVSRQAAGRSTKAESDTESV